MTTQDGGLRPADIETAEGTNGAIASEQDVDVEVANGADVASHSSTADDDPAGADDVLAEDVVADAEPVEPVEIDPAEEMRAALRRAPGDWYVVHSYAGYENKVKTNLETRVQTLDVEDYIFQVEVPTEEVTEIKNGQRKQVQRKVLPGYILVRMELNDQSWGAVRNTPGVTGFVGATSKPSPLTIDEVVKFLLPRTEAAKPAAAGRAGASDRGRCGFGQGHRRGRLRGRRVGHRDGRPVRDAAGDDQRGQRRRAEGQGPGFDLRSGDPGRARLLPGLQDLTSRPRQAGPRHAATTRRKSEMPPKKRKLSAIVKLQIKAGAATPAPPVGPALGQHGVNIMEFCKAYNAATESQRGDIVPVEISVYEDRSFTFALKTPPAARLLLKAAGVDKGSGEPHRTKVASVTMDQVRQIAQTKMADLNANDIDQAAKIIAGTARSMGITVTG